MIQEELSKAHDEIRRLTETCRNLEESLSKKSLHVDEKSSEITTARDKIIRLERELVTKEAARQ
jgi:chromosome segregation ATPase